MTEHEQGLKELDNLFEDFRKHDETRREAVKQTAAMYGLSPAPAVSSVYQRAGIIHDVDLEDCRMKNGNWCPFLRILPVRVSGCQLFCCTEPGSCRTRECPACNNIIELAHRDYETEYQSMADEFMNIASHLDND